MTRPKRAVGEIFRVFFRLGLTSFGGPIAHLGYLRNECVSRRGWLSERRYADLVALCQFLPGPASSQVGMSIGLLRGGLPGAIAAWLGFTLPSAALMVFFAFMLSRPAHAMPDAVLHGLKLVAVAVVAQAIWGMGQRMSRGRARMTITAVSALVSVLWPGTWGQLVTIATAAVIGRALLPVDARAGPDEGAHESRVLGRRAGAGFLSLFALALVGLPALAHMWPSLAVARLAAFYRSGALVFGGGHVVLPLLQAAVVPNGWISNSQFLAGYGAAQALPGPLFTFAAFLGALMHGAPNGLGGAMLCLLAIFLPSFFLVAGALPFWEQLRHSEGMQAALAGVNAAVVGLLMAAFYQPVWTSAIASPRDFGFALMIFAALVAWNVPPWAVVLASGLAAWSFTMIH